MQLTHAQWMYIAAQRENEDIYLLTIISMVCMYSRELWVISWTTCFLLTEPLEGVVQLRTNKLRASRCLYLCVWRLGRVAYRVLTTRPYRINRLIWAINWRGVYYWAANTTWRITIITSTLTTKVIPLLYLSVCLLTVTYLFTYLMYRIHEVPFTACEGPIFT